MILLVTPLACLVALYVYAASGAVGAAIDLRDSDALNADLGAPLGVLLPALETERADTFIWQSARGQTSRAALDAQRAKTDKAIALFVADAAPATGLESSTVKTLIATMETKLGQLRTVRAAVNAGTITSLAAFQDYSAIVQLAFGTGVAQGAPGESVAEYQVSRSESELGQAVEDIGQEATLVGGAFASGGAMSPALYRQFVQTVDGERLLDQSSSSPLAWPPGMAQYLAVYTSPAFMAFKALQDKIIASSPGAILPVSPKAWQASVQSVLAGFIAAQTAIRLASTSGNAHAADVIIWRLGLVGGAGLVAVILASVLLLGFGNRISRELTSLRAAARTLARERLPSVVSRLRAGEDVDVGTEAPELDLGTRTREVTDTAEAFSVVQRTAVEAAVDQARLRKGVSLVFRSLARRNQSLLQRQLRMLDEMEQGTDDPDALDRLFRLDHLTTRMRRQAEGLIILSGAVPGRVWREPVPVIEVMRAAVGEIEDYTRVDLIASSPDFMQGTAVADITHMLAELIENAVLCSPPGTRVRVQGGRVAAGYVLEVEDRGLGIPPDTMAVLNQRLAQPPEFDLVDNDRLGLFVVSRLAARHGVKVSLRESSYGGTSAIILLPPSLVVAEEDLSFSPGGIGRTAGRAGEAVAGWRRSGPERALGRALPGPAPESWDETPPSGPAAQSPRPIRMAGSPDGRESEAGPGGLPRRQAGASLAPQLREAGRDTPEESSVARSPERARDLMSSIQRGLRNSRANAPGGVVGQETGDGWGEQ
jgi:signal transduction histidine kinase